MAVSIDFAISHEQELSLHQRLVDGDATAFADLASTFLAPLIGWLTERNSADIPEEMCIEAAEDALIAFVKSPKSYNPERGKRLGAYLQMSAQADLRNILRREDRHRRNRTSLEFVELSPHAGKYLGEDDDPSLPLQIQEEVGKESGGVDAAVSDGLTDGESRVLDLMMQGERKTAVFAAALGVGHLSKPDQAAEVKRVKDKLKKRIERGTTGDG